MPPIHFAQLKQHVRTNYRPDKHARFRKLNMATEYGKLTEGALADIILWYKYHNIIGGLST
jgi:hypothetical protein